VVLRVQALIRRAAGRASPELRCGELVLDTRSNAVRLAEQPVSLTNQEFRILAYMLHHPGKVISRTEFIEHVYERDLDPDSNVLDVLIGRLRRKLGSGLIETVRGQGFRLVDADR
jgi:two-component system OmpR family response regulator